MLPDLDTDRLRLRELRPADAPRLAALHSDPAQWRLQAVEPADLTDAGGRMRQYLRHRGPHDGRRLFVYAAFARATGDLVGQASLQRRAPGVASLGLGVARDHWGAGYGTELAARLVAFGFGFARLHRIEADVAIDNAACRRVLEKIGMRCEGVARECIFAQGRWWTEAKFALLEHDTRLHAPTPGDATGGAPRSAARPPPPFTNRFATWPNVAFFAGY